MQTPTLQRCLIAPIANAGLTPDQRHRLAHLPDPECFNCIAVAGGAVLVHPNGVVLFDDWHRTPLDQSTIETEVDQVGALLALLAQMAPMPRPGWSGWTGTSSTPVERSSRRSATSTA